VKPVVEAVAIPDTKQSLQDASNDPDIAPTLKSGLKVLDKSYLE